MKAYTKTKINENKKIESSETAETPPPLPLNNLQSTPFMADTVGTSS